MNQSKREQPKPATAPSVPEQPFLETVDLTLDPAVTPDDVPALTDQQERAILALAGAKSVRAAARAAGVHPGTIHRWLRESPDFAAAHNAWQTELRDTARARLINLVERAVDVVAASLDAPDAKGIAAKTAVAILKSLALLAPIDPGSTSAEQIRHDREMDEQKQAKIREIERIKMELGML